MANVTRKDVETEQALRRVAAGVYQLAFRPAKIYEYQPRKGTLMHNLWNRERLTARHQRAWRQFCDDLHKAVGKSGPVVGSYGDGGRSSAGEFRAPVARVNAEYQRFERLVQGLIREERILLRDLIFDEVQDGGALKLEIIGFSLVGYKDEGQARAAGAAVVISLLNRVADFYNL